MHNSNKSNYINIAIVAISLGIVIFGILFLQQLFFGRRSSGVASVTTSSSNSAYRNADYYLNKSEAENQTKNTDASSSSKSGASSKSGSASSKDVGNLKTGEALVKYLGGEKNNFDIINCNLPEIHFCKAGVKLTLGSNKELKEGQNYKLSNGTITDTAEGLKMDSIDIVPVE